LADLFVALTLDTGKYIGYRYKTRKASKEETIGIIDKVFGRFNLFAVEASVHLAKGRGPAPAYVEGKTKYSKNIILGRFDLNNPSVCAELESLVGKETVENIKEGLKLHGIRNTLLSNCPPNTSTSILAGVSAGVMPAYNLVQIEDQQSGTFVHLVPLYKYPLLYDVYTRFSSLDDFDSLTDVIARIQRWIDAGISFEVVVNHNYFDTPQKLTALYLSLLAFARRKGIKAIYYFRHILKDKTTDKPEVCESCAS
jgi:ribonucleoside-diphosphate reductase alpha chain